MLATKVPYPVFFDRDGTPLDGGSVYFGVANDNPETAPATVYWDALATQPAAQPLRTSAGFISRAGTAANVFIGTDYSVLVKDSAGRVVYYARSAAEFDAGYQLIGQLAASGGSALIGFIQAGASSVLRTLQAKARDVVTFLDKGAVGDGTTNDVTAVQAAITEHPGKVIDGLGLTYKINSPLTGVASGTVIQNATFDISSMPAQAGQDKGLAIDGSIGSTVALTANTAAGSATVTVGSTATFAADGWAFMASTAVWDALQGVVYGQFVRVKSVDSATQLTLYDVANLSFNTADSATIAPVTTVKNVTFRNVKIIGAQANTQAGIYAQYAENLTVENCAFENIDYVSVAMWRCVNSTVDKCRTSFARSTGNAYGFSIWGGSWGCSVVNSWGFDNRHTVTIGDNDGVNMHSVVSGCFAIGSKDAGFDAHSASMFTTFAHNHVEMSAAIFGTSNHDGLIIQGAYAKFIGNTVKGSKNTGIHYQPLIPTTQKNEVDIVDNTIILDATGDGSTSQNGIYLDINATYGGNIDAANVSGNKVSGGTSNSNGAQYLQVLVARASAYVKNLTIDGLICVDAPPTYAILLRTNGTSASIDKVSIGPANHLRTSGTRCLYAIADGTTSTISNIGINGPIMDGGSTACMNFNGSVGTVSGIRESAPTRFQNVTLKRRIDGTVTDYLFATRDEPPATMTLATYTVLPSDEDLIANRAGTITVTLPAASVCPGRILRFKTIQAQAVDSASSNVAPVTDSVAGTSILPATDGAWAMLKSDGTNWIVMAKG